MRCFVPRDKVCIKKHRQNDSVYMKMLYNKIFSFLKEILYNFLKSPLRH